MIKIHNISKFQDKPKIQATIEFDMSLDYHKYANLYWLILIVMTLFKSSFFDLKTL